MALTLADLDTLDEAIATGALKVRYADGREVTYRSLDDMLRIRRHVAERVAPDSEAGYARTTYVQHGRD